MQADAFKTSVRSWHASAQTVQWLPSHSRKSHAPLSAGPPSDVSPTSASTVLPLLQYFQSHWPPCRARHTWPSRTSSSVRVSLAALEKLLMPSLLPRYSSPASLLPKCLPLSDLLCILLNCFPSAYYIVNSLKAETLFCCPPVQS